MNWNKTWKLIKSDVKRKTLSDGKEPIFISLLTTTLSPAATAVVFFRLQQYFYYKKIYIISKLFGLLNIMLFAVEIGPECKVGKGLLFDSPNGIYIHDHAIIGKNCTLMHQCAIGMIYRGGINKEDQLTILEDGVLVGSGVTINGPLVIGKKSIIGMNSVVSKSFPAMSVIGGIPAKIIRRLEDGEDFTAKPTERNFNKKLSLNIATMLRFIKEDLKHRAYIDGKKFTRFNYVKLFLNPSAMAVFIFRWASYFDRAFFKYLTKVLTTVNIILFNTDIGSKAEIDGGFVLGHANGVIICNQAKIGKNSVFFHHNTVAIGPRTGLDPEKDRVVIGDNFFAGAGARILGNIEIGDDCIVGMNAVVTRSAPNGSVLIGIPAKNIKTNSPSIKEPQLEIKPLPAIEKPKFSSVLSTIKKDIDKRAEIESKKSNLYYYIKVLINPPAMAVVLFRFTNYFERNSFHFPAKILYIINNLLFTVEIQARATIGPGFVIAHANGIVIHEKTIIGKNCMMTLHNSITIGPRINFDPENERIVIGDNFFAGCGARIIGNITLGNSVVVGSNAVVTKSAPDGAVLAGVPAVDIKQAARSK